MSGARPGPLLPLLPKIIPRAHTAPHGANLSGKSETGETYKLVLLTERSRKERATSERDGERKGVEDEGRRRKRSEIMRRERKK